MLTRDDMTVTNALALVEIARPLGLRHIGFKDVGADASMLQSLTAAIREAGASALDGSRVDDARGRIARRGAWPRSRRRPAAWRRSRRRGAEDPRGLGDPLSCRSPARPAAIRRGSAGPPRRSRRSAAPSPQRAARASTFSPIARPRPNRSTSSPPAGADFPHFGVVVVAGSVNSPERVAAVRAAGADAFTIGTAAIDGSYAPGAGPLAAQLGAILVDCGATG